MVASTHIPLRGRRFSLRDSHCGTFKINKNCDDLRLITVGVSHRRRLDRREQRLL
jgi:hypothetical protein